MDRDADCEDSDVSEDELLLSPTNEKTTKPRAVVVHGGQVPALIAVVFYLFVGPFLILLNKYIYTTLKFDFPVTLPALGLFTSSVISALLVKFNFVELTNEVTWSKYILAISPIGLSTSLTLYLGNRAYLYLSVSLIQLLKSITPVLTLLLLVTFNLESPTLRIWLSVALISTGTMYGSYETTTPEYSVFGLMIMFTSCFMEAFKMLLMQSLLQGERFAAIESLYYFAPISCFWMFSLVIMLEFDKLVDHGFVIMWLHPFPFILASLFGFAVNVASVFVVKTTSSLTLKVLGSVRNLGLVCVAVTFFGDIVSGQEFLGYLVSVTGILIYNYEKLQNKEKKNQIPSSVSWSQSDPEDFARISSVHGTVGTCLFAVY